VSNCPESATCPRASANLIGLVSLDVNVCATLTAGRIGIYNPADGMPALTNCAQVNPGLIVLK
jgi:hypothetical protein